MPRNPSILETTLAILSGIGKGRLRQQQTAKMTPQEDPTKAVLLELAKQEKSPYQAWALKQLGFENLPAGAGGGGLSGLERMKNIAGGMTPTGEPVGGTPIIKPPAFNDTAPPPVNVQGGMQPPQQGPAFTPSPVVGQTKATTPEQRKQALIEEADKQGMTGQQFKDFYQTTTDYQNRLNMTYSEAVNHYSNLLDVDPGQAEELKGRWEAQNPGQPKLYPKPDRGVDRSQPTGTAIMNLEWSKKKEMADAVSESIKLIKGSQKNWDLELGDKKSPLVKRVTWLNNFKARILRGTATDKDYQIYFGEVPGPWEE